MFEVVVVWAWEARSPPPPRYPRGTAGGGGGMEGEVWRSTHKAVHTEGGAHTRRSVATAGVLSSEASCVLNAASRRVRRGGGGGGTGGGYGVTGGVGVGYGGEGIRGGFCADYQFGRKACFFFILHKSVSRYCAMCVLHGPLPGQHRDNISPEWTWPKWLLLHESITTM